MSEIGFYHLTRSGALDALPKLLGRTLATGETALVLCGSRARCREVSAALWASTAPDWLPHGGADPDPPGARPEWHPIWLDAPAEPDGAVAAAPNGARFLFLLDGVPPPDQPFDRVFDLFDGRDTEAVAAARTRWTTAKAAGHTRTYWQQEERGWTRKG